MIAIHVLIFLFGIIVGVALAVTGAAILVITDRDDDRINRQ